MDGSSVRTLSLDIILYPRLYITGTIQYPTVVLLFVDNGGVVHSTSHCRVGTTYFSAPTHVIRLCTHTHVLQQYYSTTTPVVVGVRDGGYHHPARACTVPPGTSTKYPNNFLRHQTFAVSKSTYSYEITRQSASKCKSST